MVYATPYSRSVQIRRNGEYRAMVIESTDGKTIKGSVSRFVVSGTHLFTDEHRSYLGIKNYRHEVVNHSAGEYVRGRVHTNTIESVWALLKRGHYGTFHQWSKKHLGSYVDEFMFRMNTKNLPAFDKEQGACGINFTSVLVAGMEGRRLTYKKLIK